MPAASLRALLAHSIDYAGLFPPCSLELEPALRNHAKYVRAPDNWMLGTFVLPLGKFEAVSAHLSQFDRKYPLRLAVLGPKTESFTAFRAELTKTIDSIHEFSARHGEILTVNHLEMPLPPEVNASLLVEARSIAGELAAFWEAPADTAERTIALLAEDNSGTNVQTFGYKLRTGGVTADKFPSAAQIAKALVASAKYRVPIKFTAGLHHPLRQFRAEVEAKMHGFLNVLGAAVLTAEHDWDEQQTATMLEDENAGSFSFDADSFAWREWKIATDRIKARRELVTSFGSCSFDEPREDLRTLRLF